MKSSIIKIKNMKKLIYILGIAALVSFSSSCSKFVEGEDVSPNQPAKVTPQLLLSNCQVALFATANGQLARQTSMLVQQTTGVNFQSKDYNDYDIEEGSNKNEWQVIYQSGLINSQKLYDEAGAANPHYQGLSRILSAMLLGYATDLWGDVPNREALKGFDGPANYSPKFDAQADVISDMQKYLDEAITLLAKPASANTLLPSSDDLIFSGDPDAWIRTAWVLKARYHNRISKRDGASQSAAITDLTAAYAAGLSGSADDCNAKFGTNGNEYNQWYAFTKVARIDYMKAGKTLTDIMNGWNDPRISSYCEKDSGGVYEGTPANVANQYASEVGNYLASANADFPLVTYVEAKFIEAEAKFASDKPGAALAHNEAVLASVKRVTGTDAPAPFVTAQASETGATITLDKILTHKYVALFGQVEVYSDWRRTGIPALTPNSAGLVAYIPRILPTTLDERLYNKNAPKVSLSDKVWWDN